MTKTDKQALRAKAEMATQGEWWSDSVGNEGTYGAGDDCVEGFISYAVYDKNNQILLDTLNSSAACIQEEYDGEGHVAWDEVGQRNTEFIAAANPQFVLALLDEVEANEKRMAKLESDINSASERYENRVPTQWAYDQACVAIGKHRSRAEAAEKRIANLFSALKLIESEVSERFDMDDSKTNPGIKHAVEQAQSALSAGIALDTGE